MSEGDSMQGVSGTKDDDEDDTKLEENTEVEGGDSLRSRNTIPWGRWVLPPTLPRRMLTKSRFPFIKK
jgi:hypothetical protein